MNEVFMMNFGQAEQAARDFMECSNKIQKIQYSIMNVKNSKSVSWISKRSLSRSLNDILGELAEEERNIGVLKNTLTDTINTYRNAERNICMGEAQPIAIGADIAGVLQATVVEKKNSFAWTAKDWWKIVSKAGAIGSGVATVGSLITGDKGTWDQVHKTAIDSGKFLLTSIGGFTSAVASFAQGGKWTDYLWGGNVGPKGFGSSIKKQLVSDLGFTGAATTADKIKVATKWGGHALTLMGNVVDNVKEYQSGEISGLRAGVETVLETATDIGVGVLATAAVAITGAPAIVAGVASAVVVWAANGACKWATEKLLGKQLDLGEAVADGTIYAVKNAFNVGKEVVKGVVDVGEAAVSAAKSACRTARNWAKNIFRFA